MLYSFENNTDKEKFLFSLARWISIYYNAELPVFSYAYIKILKNQGLNDEEITMRLKSDTSGVISTNTAGEVLKTAVTVVSDIVPIFGNTVGRFGEKAVNLFLEKVNEKRKNDMDDASQSIRNRADLLRELNDYVSDYKVLSDDDLEIIKDTMEDYSGFIYSPEEGLLISERIYEALSERYGEGHPKTIEAVDEYSFAFDNTDRKDQELDLWKGIQKRRAEMLGGAHKSTLDALETIVGILEVRGELDKALGLRWEEYEECKKELGDEDGSTSMSLSDLTKFYIKTETSKTKMN